MGEGRAMKKFLAIILFMLILAVQGWSATVDLSLTKTAPATVYTGVSLAYTFTVKNNSLSSTSNVKVIDTLPSEVTYVSKSGNNWTCSGTTTVTCTYSNTLSAGSTASTLVLNTTAPATIPATNPITNTATVSQTTTNTDPTSANNTATAKTTIVAPMCSAYKGVMAINEVYVGASKSTSIKNKIELYNINNISPTIWRNWRIVITRISNGSLRTYTYPLTSFVDTGGFITNSNVAIYLRTMDRQYDIALWDAPTGGNLIDYVALNGYTNNNLNGCTPNTPPAYKITNTDSTKKDLYRWSPDGTGAWNFANISGTIGRTNGCTSGNNLIIDQTLDVPQPMKGDTITYVVTATNPGCLSLTNVSVTNSLKLPTNLTSFSYTCATGTCSSSTGLWTLPSIPAQQTTSLTIIGTVPSSASVGTVYTNTAVGNVINDINYLNNTDSDSATVMSDIYANIDLALTDLNPYETDQTSDLVVRLTQCPRADVTIPFSIVNIPSPTVISHSLANGSVLIRTQANGCDPADPSATVTYNITPSYKTTADQNITVTLGTPSPTNSKVVLGTDKTAIITIYNDPNYTLLVDDDNLECPNAPFNTITDALAAATAGDTVSVCKGTYNEMVTINENNLTIVGQSGNKDDVIVTDNGTVFSIAGQNATIKNLTVDNTSATAGNGINTLWTAGGSHTFDNLKITSGDTGIYLQSSSAVSYFSNLDITSTAGSGIDTGWNADGAHSFSNIVIDANKYGIYAEQGAGNFSNIKIKSVDKSLYLTSKYASTFDKLDLNSTSNMGINITSSSNTNPFTVTNSIITSSNIGIKFDQSSKINISDTNITSTAGDGVSFAWDSQGTHEIKRVIIGANNGSGIVASHGLGLVEDFNITAKTFGINLTNHENTIIHRGFITTSSDKGINLTSGATKSITVQDTVISAATYGINLSASSAATIDRVCINKATIGISADWSANNVIVQNSKINGNSDKGASINSGTKAVISANCFQKSPFATRGWLATPHSFNGNYWNGTVPSDGQGVFDTVPLSSCPVVSCYGDAPLPVPIADYHMDECTWNGTTGEVKDDSGNNLNGTAINSAQIITSGKTGNAGTFIKTNDYINIGHPTLNLTNEITVMAWVNEQNLSTSGLGNWSSIISYASLSPDNALFQLQHNTDNTKYEFAVKTSSGRQYVTSTSTTVLNTWNLITGVYDGSKVRIYVNGAEVSAISVSLTGTLITPTADALLQIGQTQGGTRNYKGFLDEIKIFNHALSAQQIQNIYTNENSGKNYDGTSRTVPCCCVPTGGNLIANPSFETLCGTSIVQTFGNVEGGTVNMRSNICGWNMNGVGMETWEGTTLKPASNGTVFVEIDGYTTTVDQLSQILKTVSGTHYVISFDYRARNGGSDRIIAKWNGAATGTFTGITTGWQTAQMEVVGTGSDTLTFEEPSADNDSYGSWIDNIRVAVGTLVTDCTSFKYEPYHSYNTSLTPSYRLQTRIANQRFDDLNVTVTCANSGTVPSRKIKNVYAIDASAAICNVTTPKLFTLLSNGAYDINETNRVINIPDITITKAYSNIKLMLETNASEFNCSTDSFAVRPPSFSITSPIPSTKATNFTLQLSALNSGNGYNGTANVTTGLQTPNTNCPTSSGFLKSSLGTAEPLSLIFNNDINSSTAKATDVGTISINTKDTTWTAIDQPNDCIINSNTTIMNGQGLMGCNIDNNLSLSITPDHFDVNATLSNFGRGTFTYLSTDLNMSAQLDLNITAINGDGNTTKNYTSGCYSKDTSVTLPHSTVPSPLSKISYLDSLANPTIETHITKDKNITSNYNDSNFSQGSVTSRITFNFDRNSSTPLNPFNFTVNSADVNNTDHVLGAGIPLGNTQFIYGRARAYDVTTNEASAPNPIEFEVYSTVSTGFVNGMHQNVLNWYQNLNHDSSLQGIVINGGYIAGGANMASIAVPQDGVQAVTITSIQNQTIHLDISQWLWYSSTYSYNYATNCTQHPCFQYGYKQESTLPVDNGFKGSDYNMAPAKNVTKKGAKFFR